LVIFSLCPELPRCTGRFLAQKGNNLLVSNDLGKTSSQIIFGDGRALGVWSLAGDGDGDAVVGTTAGIYWSNDSGRTWKNLEASYVPAETASIFPFEETVLAQEVVPPRVEIPRIGPTGPPVLPPLETGRNIGQIPKLETPLNPCPYRKLNLTCGGSFVRVSLAVPCAELFAFVCLASRPQLLKGTLLLLRSPSAAIDPAMSVYI
jgi:hypothetical protein